MEKLGPFKQAVKDATERAEAKRIERDGMVYHEYPDYDRYREVQVAGNKAKIGMQFVKQSHIERLAHYLNERGHEVGFGLCHGTRRGREQKWFRKHLAGRPEILGTEISDTAGAFANTVQWDFHDANPEWMGRADLIYSNSWDHAFDLEKALSVWIDTLSPGGLLFLDHCKGQEPHAANALDPVGAEYDVLKTYIGLTFAGRADICDELDYRDNKQYRARVLVLRQI